jgi:DNA repair protein RecN (Recombination protein N)
VLQELHLRDLGVISEAGVDLSPGLNVVTGETGVGKTLLITSLALLTGARGQARLVRDGATEAVVQAVVSPTARMSALLAERGLDADGDLVLVRRLAADGRSRAWVGGQLVPMSVIAEIGECLVEVHGQGAGFALARPATQLAAVDALAGNDDDLIAYRAALALLRTLEDEQSSLRTGESTRRREIDLFSHQIEEIERAALEPGEEDAIGASLSRLEHAERLRGIGEQTLALAGAEGAAGELADAHQTLRGAVQFDPTAEDLVTRLAGVSAEASDLAREIRAWNDTLEADPSQLETLRDRRALVANLKRKYAAGIEEILAVAEEARSRLDELTQADSRIATIDADVDAARDAVTSAAAALSKRRRRAAKELSKLVGAELPALALPNAIFEVSVGETEFTVDGADSVEFLFSSSRGKPADAIGKIASGGELSRAMIAVTLALARTHDVPVLVFDEADQGIGGEAALELGRRLARLGRSHQVLVVSHLPQLAAFADRHIAVRRSGDDVQVDVLDDGARLAEISRMLAGLESSERARAHAAELLELAAVERGPSAPARAV